MVFYYTSEDLPVQESYLLMESTVQIIGNKKEKKNDSYISCSWNKTV